MLELFELKLLEVEFVLLELVLFGKIGVEIVIKFVDWFLFDLIDESISKSFEMFESIFEMLDLFEIVLLFGFGEWSASESDSDKLKSNGIFGDFGSGYEVSNFGESKSRVIKPLLPSWFSVVVVVVAPLLFPLFPLLLLLSLLSLLFSESLEFEFVPFPSWLCWDEHVIPYSYSVFQSSRYMCNL